MISDNNHITYSAEDIQRYWNGQLSPQEMHAMEKAALDDPFLADAMEGIGLAMQEHDEKLLNTQLAEMREQLKTSATGTVRTMPVRSIRWWQVAAAAFVLMAVGYWIFSSGRSDKDGLVQNNKEMAATQAPDSGTRDGETATAKTSAPAAVSDSIEITAGLSAKQGTEPGLYEFETSSPDKKRKKSTPVGNINDRVTRSFSKPQLPEVSKERQDAPLAARTAPPPANTNLDSVRPMETEVIKLQENTADLAKAEDKSKDSEPKLQNIISGVVTDNKNNPLPNVFIRLENKNSYTTDPSGNFKIPASDSVVNVSVSLQGYATQNFRLRSTHDGAGSVRDNQIRLQSNAEMAANQALTNVYYDTKLRAKYDNEKFSKKVTQQDAQPVLGWVAYQQYLDNNKRKPASNPNLIGEVAVSFDINKKGERSAYEIEKSLSPDHDAEALRLIREGPAWKLNKGRKSRVTVIVRF